MVGRLSERPQGGKGLYIAASHVAACMRMDDLAAELGRHEIPHRVYRQDMRIFIEPLRVEICFMAVQNMEHRVQGMELNMLVDDATAAVKLSERQ
jgi:hypothetical protein